jgi:hypothetical protein
LRQIKEGKMFFSEEKNQKTFTIFGVFSRAGVSGAA